MNEQPPDDDRDIVLSPHPHRLVCPSCGLERNLPDGWQAILGVDELICSTDDVAMVKVD